MDSLAAQLKQAYRRKVLQIPSRPPNPSFRGRLLMSVALRTARRDFGSDNTQPPFLIRSQRLTIALQHRNIAAKAGRLKRKWLLILFGKCPTFRSCRSAESQSRS
jgi:hypothetical protein